MHIAHICACTQLSCPYECGRGTWHAAAGNTTAAEAPAATLPSQMAFSSWSAAISRDFCAACLAVCILPFDTAAIPTSASVPTRVGLLGSFKQRAFRAWHASRDLRDAPYSTKSLAICCSRNKDTHQPSSWGLLSSRLSVGRYKGAQELLRVSGRPLEPHRQYLGSPTHCYWSQLGNQTTPSNKGPSSPRRPTWRPEVLLSSITLCQPSSRVFVSHQVSWNCRKFQPADK